MKTQVRRRPFGICALFLLAFFATSAHATLVHSTDTLVGNAYDIWREPADSTWRFACQTPCPIPLTTLQSAANGFLSAKQQLLGLSGIDTLASLRPVDIVFEANSICPANVNGYSSTYLPYGGTQRRAILCTFQWDRQQAGTISYFTPSNAGLPTSQAQIVRLYGLSIFVFRKRFAQQDFVRYWSYRVSGEIPLPNGLCSQNLAGTAPLVYELCQRYSATDSDIRAAMARIDQLYQLGMGYNLPGYSGAPTATSMSQLRQAFDERFGVDTRPMFLDLGYAPQDAGGTYTAVPVGSSPTVYSYDFRLPNGSFTLQGVTLYSIPIKLEQPSCLPSSPFVDFQLAFDLVGAAHHEGDGVAAPNFAGSLYLSYSFAHARPDPRVNPANYRFYRATASCGQPGLGWQEVSANIDLVNKRVSTSIIQGGTYALFQPDVMFKSGFETP